MLSIRSYIRQHHLALVALFFALGGGTAWAANTIGSQDIIDGEVKEADVGQGAVTSSELKNDSIVASDVAPNALPTGRIADNSLTGTDVANNSLTGADVDESSLSLSLGNADKLDNFEANQLLRVSQAREENSASAVVFSSKETVDVTAPKGGFVLVIANASAQSATDAECDPCSAHARLSEPGAGVSSPAQFSSLDATSTTANGAIMVTHLFPATAGPHTYSLDGGQFPGAGVDIQFRNPTITALFVPFDGAGTQGP